MEIDKKTRDLSNLLLEIIEVAEIHGRDFFVSGGFALDIQTGELTRSHADLDLHPMEVDISWWKSWFKKKNFKISYNDEMRDRTKAFEAHSPRGSFYVDMYGVKIHNDGQISSAESGERKDWVGATWQEKIKKDVWEGKEVNVLDYRDILWLKKEVAKMPDYGIRGKDAHDLSLFRNTD
ncbi:MAG: nucleotidyltransferase domain-containing protein [Patescibacteria group bacterium]